jgi:hypothetical protein
MIEQTSDTEKQIDPTSDTRSNYVGPLADPGLAMLRETVKNVMIPLLIKVFHVKLEVQQASSPPSRLQNKQPEHKVDDLIGQLSKLDEDLQLMIGWCQSCRNQVQKVITEVHQECKSPSPIHSAIHTNPAVQKSFTEALAGQNEQLKKANSYCSVTETQAASSLIEKKEKWWNRFF